MSVEAKPLCACCGEEPATCGDPHVGDVCADCYVELINARAVMEIVGPIAGIGRCQEKPA